jgi:hypothetical protein
MTETTSRRPVRDLEIGPNRYKALGLLTTTQRLSARTSSHKCGLKYQSMMLFEVLHVSSEIKAKIMTISTITGSPYRILSCYL